LELALFALLVSCCFGLQIMPRPPNVEFTSFFVFIIALMEGGAIGACVGSIVMLVNGFASPWGFGGFNIPFQMAGMVVAGLVGGVYRRFTQKVLFSKKFCLEAAVLGGLIALAYDLVTNFGFYVQLLIFGESSSVAFLTVLSLGSFFSLVHIVSSIIVFGVLFLPVGSALNRLKGGKL
jgi:hypothetical protein